MHKRSISKKEVLTGFFFCAIMSADDMSMSDVSRHDMLKCDIEEGNRRSDGLRQKREGDMVEGALLKKYRPMTETTYYTLLAVTKPRHGYAIMQFVNGLTEGRIRLGTGTLYTMTGRLSEDGLITIVSQENGKKTYGITETGRELLLLETERLKYQLRNGLEILQEEMEDGGQA